MTILELAALCRVTTATIQNHAKNGTYRLDLAKRKRAKGEQFVIFEGPRLAAYIGYMEALNRAKEIKRAAKRNE